jgi:Zn-dependent protease with chaperone function
VIYYNPALMERFGPELAAFFMAHERAHIALKHTRSGALRADPTQRDRMLQQKELEADCRAARSLGAEGRYASLAAVRFFSKQGGHSYDAEHPSGTRRAQKILSCMPK